MKNVVLLDICLRKLTLAPQRKQVIKEILGRLSAAGPRPVKQTISLFLSTFCLDEGAENAEAHFLVISFLNSRRGVGDEGNKKKTLHEAFEVGAGGSRKSQKLI